MVKNKARKKRDGKPGPKRPLPAFFYYIQERRKSLKLERPNLKATEINTEIGREWRKLSDQQKEPFAKLAAEDKKRYETEKKSLKEVDKDLPQTDEVELDEDSDE